MSRLSQALYSNELYTSWLVHYRSLRLSYVYRSSFISVFTCLNDRRTIESTIVKCKFCSMCCWRKSSWHKFCKSCSHINKRLQSNRITDYILFYIPRLSDVRYIYMTSAGSVLVYKFGLMTRCMLNIWKTSFQLIRDYRCLQYAIRRRFCFISISSGFGIKWFR